MGSSMLAQLRTRHKAKSECVCVLVTVFNRPMGERVGNDKCVVRAVSVEQRSRMKIRRGEHANCPPKPALLLLPPAVSPCENLLLGVPAHTT
jgi:hypothetical protein